MALADVVGHSIYVKHWHTSSSLSSNSVHTLKFWEFDHSLGFMDTNSTCILKTTSIILTKAL